MTRAEHIAQRDRVAASLRLPDTPEARHAVYPVRARETGASVPQTGRESMRQQHRVRKVRP